MGVCFGRSWKHVNRNHDISEIVEAGADHMLLGSQRVSGRCKIHVQAKDKVKELKEQKSRRGGWKRSQNCGGQETGRTFNSNRVWLTWGYFPPIPCFLKTLPDRKGSKFYIEKKKRQEIFVHAPFRPRKFPFCLRRKELDCQMGGNLAASL